jgi:hypothetical protein
MKICRPTQHFGIVSYSATCLDLHDPSSGRHSFLNSLKNTGKFEHAVILLVRSL